MGYAASPERYSDPSLYRRCGKSGLLLPSLAQMALQWVLRDGRGTSAIIGVSRPLQVLENLKTLSYPEHIAQEIAEIG